MSNSYNIFHSAFVALGYNSTAAHRLMQNQWRKAEIAQKYIINGVWI